MSSKDDFLFKKNNLVKTNSGRKILKKGLFRDEGYIQFKKYIELSKKEYDSFVLRFQKDIFELIESDTSSDVTHEKFLKEIGGSQELRLDLDKFHEIKKNLLIRDNLTDRIKRILNSNFIKMTFPVFYALFDGYMKFTKNSDINMRNDIIDGHLIAIDLSEPMDRIIDKDED